MPHFKDAGQSLDNNPSPPATGSDSTDLTPAELADGQSLARQWREKHDRWLADQAAGIADPFLGKIIAASVALTPEQLARNERRARNRERDRRERERNQRERERRPGRGPGSAIRKRDEAYIRRVHESDLTIQVSDRAFRVYMWLLFYRNSQSGNAWCGEATLGRRMGKKVTDGKCKTVQRAVGELVRIGRVQRRQRRRPRGKIDAGRWSTNEYRVIEPEQAEIHRGTNVSAGANLTGGQICPPAHIDQEEIFTNYAHAHEEFEPPPLQLTLDDGDALASENPG